MIATFSFCIKFPSSQYLTFILTKKSTEKTWFFWIIGMSLTTIFLGNAFERDFNVLTTTRPTWLSTFTTISSATHILPYFLFGRRWRVDPCLIATIKIYGIKTKFLEEH